MGRGEGVLAGWPTDFKGLKGPLWNRDGFKLEDHFYFLTNLEGGGGLADTVNGGITKKTEKYGKGGGVLAGWPTGFKEGRWLVARTL